MKFAVSQFFAVLAATASMILLVAVVLLVLITIYLILPITLAILLQKITHLRIEWAIIASYGIITLFLYLIQRKKKKEPSF